jgi:hypothetical protein
VSRRGHDLPPHTHGFEVTLQVRLWIALLALEIPARDPQFAQERPNRWVGPTFEGNGLAMECARLDEARDPEMGGWQAVRLRFRSLGLGLEQLS